MPKVKETKKLEQPVKAPTIAPVASEPQKVVFRTFECVVHAEEALEQLEQIGIFPQGKFKQEHTAAVLAVKILVEKYGQAWREMQNL